MNQEKTKVPSAVCPNCGGQLEINALDDYAICPYCGTKHLVADILNESDYVRVQKMKLKAYKELQVQEQKNKIETEKRYQKKANMEAFKKSGMSSILVISSLISLLLCVATFRNGNIYSGIVAAVMAVLFIIAYFMGLHLNNGKMKDIYIIPIIISIALIVPLFYFADMYNQEKLIQKLNWSDFELGTVLPQVEAPKGKIINNSKDCLNFSVKDFNQDKYNSYVNKCIEKGFTVESKKENKTYKASNSEGYYLELFYIDPSEIGIILYAPKNMGKIKWPGSDVANTLPVPKSDYGKIEWDNSDGFLIYIGNTTKDAFNEYAESCKEKGYNINYKKEDDFYSANDAKGYHLDIDYYGNDIMSIEVRKANKYDK